jgi:hypothetical protein
MNVLFYGNCQTDAIKSILNLNESEFNCYNIQCYITQLTEDEFKEIINKCDIIITQPIHNNYRDKVYLSTDYIINNCKKNCKIIVFESCYFDFYYFDLTYKIINNENLRKPIDYHYNELINCYKNNLSIEYYLENYVNNIDFKTIEYLQKKADNSFEELNKRCNQFRNTFEGKITFISIIDYIKNNYKNILLFYSMNHPTKYLLQHICHQIINVSNIKNTINYDIDPLDYCKCILYKSIQKVVNFNIDECTPFLFNKINNYDIIKLYYDTYKCQNINFI